ncbi:uncharacterized protein LOC115534011 isoform X5 [Gadus morhua]|uniref:uncharacterized protein LOC115534011 isoform X5 n=1 Tax=Gadus morhua TaxID=8049 RepID=UPI0011B6F858|nr:uncharacterized protein LOC115534011 isoform X5 [Gadus morhua]
MVMAGQDFGAEGKAAVNRLTTTVREWGKRSKEWAESSLKSVIPKVDSRQAYHKYRFTTVNGLNLNTDNDLVEKLKAKGHTQVKSSDPCDYILAFCPISTRPGINIQETMEMCTAPSPFSSSSTSVLPLTPSITPSSSGICNPLA